MIRTPNHATKVKHALISMLAALLLLAPVCRVVCHAQACGAARDTAAKTPCHEASGSRQSGQAHLHSEGACDLRELPAMLPSGVRISGVNPAVDGRNPP